MKKNFTILSAILITLFSLNAKAQDDENKQAKSYLSFNGGISTPLGSYASSNYYNNNNGFAKKGTTFGLDAGIYLHKNLALGITFSYQDQGELNASDVQNLANGYNSSFTKNTTSVQSVNRFNNLNLLVGPQYSFLYKKFTFDIRASGGIIKSLTTPSIIIVSSNSSNTYNQLSSGAVAWAYGGSAGLRYSLGDTWDVGLHFSYLDSSGLKISNTGGLTASQGRLQIHMPVTVFQSTLGIVFKF